MNDLSSENKYDLANMKIKIQDQQTGQFNKLLNKQGKIN